MSNNQIQISNRQTLTGVTHDEFTIQAPALIRARSLAFPIERVHLEGEPPPVPKPQDLPSLVQRNGNLFGAPSEKEQMWYLPDFILVDDPDPAFGFAAVQAAEIDQATGSPFNKCRFSMTVRKIIPADAAAWLAANPTGHLREVPLEGLEGAIVIQTVSQGVLQSTPCQATLAPSGERDFLLTADSILGVSVISLYQNLIEGGNAKCVVSGRFLGRLLVLRPIHFETRSLGLDRSLEIGQKYRSNQYRLKYTISTTGAPRVIVNAADLRDFNVHQSEFVELRALGDITARFPSISKLYFGVVRKAIIVIPARYVILRESGVCAAACTALVDSSPGLNSGCKFQIAFTLVPDVSSIDLLLLLNEINASPEAELHGSTLSLPRAFDLGPDVALATSFLSSFRYVEGAIDLQSISLSVEIKEQLGGTPAIANANLFLAQLRVIQEPFLTGSIRIRLDDAFSIPIDVPVLLNFTQTQANSSAGLTLRLDEADKKAIIENGSSFDLRVTRIALLTPQRRPVVADVGQVIRASGSLSLELPTDHAGLTVLFDCEIEIAANLSKTDLFRLLQFHTVDVQNTQCLLSVNATAVNFIGRAIDQIEIMIALSATPEIPVATLVVRTGRTIDSTRILLPFDQAMVELNAILLLKVSFTDAARPAAQFTLQNDFGQHPIFQIADDNIPT